MLLEYEPSSAQLSVKESPKTRGSGERSLEGPGNHIMSQRSLENQLSVEGSGVRIERWNSEQIGDFVRKLGFMDKEKEGGDRIKHFLHLTQVRGRGGVGGGRGEEEGGDRGRGEKGVGGKMREEGGGGNGIEWEGEGERGR